MRNRKENKGWKFWRVQDPHTSTVAKMFLGNEDRRTMPFLCPNYLRKTNGFCFPHLTKAQTLGFTRAHCLNLATSLRMSLFRARISVILKSNFSRALDSRLVFFETRMSLPLKTNARFPRAQVSIMGILLLLNRNKDSFLLKFDWYILPQRYSNCSTIVDIIT